MTRIRFTVLLSLLAVYVSILTDLISCGPPDPYQSQPASPSDWCTGEPGFVLREGACVPVAEGARFGEGRDGGAGP